MRLSPNFSLHEFTTSQTATRYSIDNEPTPEILHNLRRLAYTLEIIRNELGSPIYISSGYRSPELNKKIGGSKRSAHMQGLAADFVVRGYSVANTVKRIRPIIGFDKLINEFERWIHIGLSDHHLNQVLIATKEDGKTKYEAIS